jgi:hypothetical protein
MESFMWSALVSFLLGVGGWLLTGFFGKPLLDFQNLRSQVHEEIIFTGNIGARVKGEVKYDEATRDKAVDSLRRLAAKVLATEATAWFLLRRFLSMRGYDLVKAGGGLIGLSNCLSSTDGTRAVYRNSIQDALKLPATVPTTACALSKRCPGHQRSDRLISLSSG